MQSSLCDRLLRLKGRSVWGTIVTVIVVELTVAVLDLALKGEILTTDLVIGLAIALSISSIYLILLNFILKKFDSQQQCELNDQEFKREKERFEAFFNNNPELMVISSLPDGIITDVNDAFCCRTGFSRAEALGHSPLGLGLWSSASDRQKMIEAISKQGYCRDLEFEFTLKDGTKRIGAYSAVVTTIQHQPHLISSVHDITERKQAERALAESNALLQTIIDTAPLRLFWKDTGLRYLGCNTAFARDAGKTSVTEVIGRDDFDMGWREQAELYRADDRRVLDTGLSRLNYEEPQTTPDGKQIWLRTSKVPLHDRNNAIIGVLGIYQDITRQRIAEEKLRLASLVLEHSSEAMFVTDADNRILDINPAFSKLTGYKAGEVIGQTPGILNSGQHSRDFYREMWQAVEDSGHWQGEIWNKRKNGEIFAEWQTINTIYNDDGSVHRRVSLFSDITERKRSEEVIWSQANFDSLTKLPNRRMFRDRLAQDIKKAHRANLKLALLFLDLDRFKEVNDTLGHDQGDILLIEAARRIAACLRESDTVARLGGDEFTIILADLEDSGGVERIASDIIQALNQPFKLNHHDAYVSASIGITLYPDDATELEELLKNADQAMFVSKRAGRNRFSYFTPTMQEAAQHRMRILSELRQALAAGQFELYYQPIVELQSGQIHKAEALLRWFHPTLGAISPAEFIPLAEDSGLIHQLGNWMFAEAARQVQRWQALYRPDFQISVNVSPLQINGFDAPWLQQIQTLSLDGLSFVFEITEGLLLDTSDHVTRQLLSLRDAGIQVAIDDFGTGYSALSYLKKLDIDYLKIDQSFVHNLTPLSSDLALCEAIVVMAHKLELEVIAEGVETEQQNSLLASIGCDYVQGYFQCKPLPAEQFERFMASDRR